MEKLILVSFLALLQPLSLAVAAEDGPEESNCGKIIQVSFGKNSRGSQRDVVSTQQQTVLEEGKEAVRSSLRQNLRVAIEVLSALRAVLQISDRTNDAESVTRLGNVKLINGIDLGYAHLVDYLPAFDHPDIVRVLGEEGIELQTELKQKFLIVHYMIRDPRFLKAIAKIGGSLKPLGPYQEKTLKDFFPTEVAFDRGSVDWEFTYPFHRRMTALMLNRNIDMVRGWIHKAIRLASNQFTQLSPDEVFLPTVADDFGRRSLLLYYQEISSVVVEIAPMLKRIAEDVLSTLPPGAEAHQKVSGLIYEAIYLYETYSFQTTLERESFVDRTLHLRPALRASRFGTLPADKERLKELKSQLDGRAHGK